MEFSLNIFSAIGNFARRFLEISSPVNEQNLSGVVIADDDHTRKSTVMI